jgi:hypothetical protein
LQQPVRLVIHVVFAVSLERRQFNEGGLHGLSIRYLRISRKFRNQGAHTLYQYWSNQDIGNHINALGRRQAIQGLVFMPPQRLLTGHATTQ